MAFRVWRLLLVGALACAVVGTGARSASGVDARERLGTTAVVIMGLHAPVDSAVVPLRPDGAMTLLAAGRSSWTTIREWPGAGGFTVPAVAVIASLAVALAICVHLDVAPTARRGLARRRGPPSLLLVRT
jgi:hypothetical protein